MCNYHGTSVPGEAKGNNATESTKRHYERIAQNADYMSYAKAAPNAEKGLLESAEGLEIGEKGANFSLAKYKFLKKDNNAENKTVHPALWEHAKLNMNVGLYRVNRIEQNEKDGKPTKNANGKYPVRLGDVFQVRGYDLANMTLVRGDKGWIILDVLTCDETAEAAFEFVKRHLDCNTKEHTITGVFYSHSHVDHYGGIAGIVDKDDVLRKDKDGNPINDGTVEIIAPEGFMHYAVSENIYAGNAMNSRAVFMYGAFLERGSKGQVDNGLGKATAVGTNSLIAPTEEIGFQHLAAGKRYVIREIDGIEFHCQITPGTEAPAEMNVYMPDTETMFIAENCTGTLHNLYTLRGAEVRDSMAWAD